MTCANSSCGADIIEGNEFVNVVITPEHGPRVYCSMQCAHEGEFK